MSWKCSCLRLWTIIKLKINFKEYILESKKILLIKKFPQQPFFKRHEQSKCLWEIVTPSVVSFEVVWTILIEDSVCLMENEEEEKITCFKSDHFWKVLISSYNH